jgi:diguanylate cyclase (GGDEF)-like protein
MIGFGLVPAGKRPVLRPVLCIEKGDTVEEDLFNLVDDLDALIKKEEEQRPTGFSTIPKPFDCQRCQWPSFYNLSCLMNTNRMDFNEVLETVLDITIGMTGAKRGFLILVDDRSNLLVEIGRNDKEESLDPTEFEFSRSIVKRTLESRKPLLLPNIEEDKQISSAGSVAEMGLLSAMCVPLILTIDQTLSMKKERRRFFYPVVPEVLGVLYVDSTLTTGTFKEEDLNFFEALANYATATIVNARLYQQASTDSLTRCLTRRQLDYSLQEAEKKWRAAKAPFSLLMMDVDHFKRINDAYGHLVGDEVLKRLTQITKGSVRVIDLCFRYGGEEFAILLSDTDVEGAVTIAEKIRKQIEALRLEGVKQRITVSIGIASFPLHTPNMRDLIKQADQALYQAKLNGRNRVEAWNEKITAGAKRKDRLAGIITGDFATDYNNVMLVLDTILAINSTMELNQLLTLTVDKIIEATGAERGALMLADDKGKLETVVSRDRLKQNLKLVEKFSRTIPAKVLETGDSICVVDAEGEEEAEKSKSVAELNLRTIMCVPLTTKEKIIGVIYVDSRSISGDLQESNLPFFEALARQVAFAIENARLKARLAYEGGIIE